VAGEGELRAYLARIAAGLGDAVAELQDFLRGIQPAILSERGLGPALRALARRSAVPVDLDVTAAARCPSRSRSRRITSRLRRFEHELAQGAG
jgi:hypothetical protein